MSRPRLSNHHLASGVRFQHGSYYRVVRGNWMRIGKEYDPRSVPERIPGPLKAIFDYAVKIMRQAKQNAKGRRGLVFELDRGDLYQMLNDAGWRCAVTRVTFDFTMVAGKRPFAPSIDRIDSAKGYVKGNCRIVCVAANYAMNVWGEDVLHKMLRSTRRPAKSQGAAIVDIVNYDGHF